MSVIPYVTIDRKRAATLGQVTKILNSVNNFDPQTQSVNVLKGWRDTLTSLHRTHQNFINSMMDHVDADFERIDEIIDLFREAHINATALVNDKLDQQRGTNEVDDLPTLVGDLAALRFHLAEFESFVEECDTDCLTVSELRMRLKDLQPLHSKYITVWNQIHDRSDDERKEELKNERKAFTVAFYKTVGWFDNQVTSRSPAESPPSAPKSFTPSNNTRLPKIELPKFDGSPDTWIAFRDAFKSIVHNEKSLSGALKFRYLNTSITDKHSPINHLLESDDGYEEAWQAVIDFYDDKRRIVDCHFSGMLSVKGMNAESHEELQRILNEYSLHIASLERMHTEEELYRAMLAHLVIQRLDKHTRDLWETENKGNIPFWPDLQRFLKERRKTLSSMPAVKSAAAPTTQRSSNPAKKSWGTSNVHATSKGTAPSSRSPSASSAHNSQRADCQPSKPRKCLMCSGDHRLIACNQFLNLSIPQRLSKVKEWQNCSNCLGAHLLSNCISKYVCRHCKERHHTMLHMEKANGAQAAPTPPLFQTSAHALQAPAYQLQASASPFTLPKSSFNTTSGQQRSVTLLMTAIVKIQDAQGAWHSARAFLDTASDSNYIAKRVATALNLPTESTHIEVKGLGGAKTKTIKFATKALVGNMVENIAMDFLVTPKVTNPTPMSPIDPTSIGIPSHLPLADPSFCVPGDIDILIGNAHVGRLLRDGLIPLESGPVLINSVFGWLFSGSIPQVAHESARSETHTASCHHLAACNHNSLVDLRNSVEKFYKLEDYRTEKRFLTDEEAFTEKVFDEYHSRTPDGRFLLHIPFKDNLDQIINNYLIVLCIFLATEKRMQKNHALLCAYIDFMREYEKLGHMTEIDISDEPRDEPAYYFPHHGVENPESATTSLRVVFNGSSRTASGLSLNDAQCVGPQIQTDAFTLMLQFRQYLIVIKADIAKMYRQILIAAHQARRYQRIFWRESPELPLKIYALNTLTYGTASATFESTRCLKQLGIESKEKFPKAAEELINKFYVDDYISGASSVEEAASLAKDVSAILASAGMKLRKFNSNNAEFLESIPEEDREVPKPDTHVKTLGIKWDPVTDTIGFDIKPIEFHKITRRTILSEVSRIYDPEGLLGPVIFRFKLFLKAIYRLKLPWDTQITGKDAEDWTQIASTFPQLNQIRIPRHVVIENFTDVQLHGFCDASDLGYGAAVYVRSENSAGEVKCHLVCAKSRIAPNEYRSTARLELCGAVVLALLMSQVSKALKLPFSKKVCWSDSAIVLHWLKKLPCQLQIFVANRISEIQELSFDIIWRHIKGILNPADLISRGLTPEDILDCCLWWFGPEFLVLPESQWPVSIVTVDPNEPSYINEFKKVESFVFATSTDDSNPFREWIENSSRTWAVKRKLAPIMRFIHNARAIKTNKQRRHGPIQVSDMIDAEYAMARIYQAALFPEEFQHCTLGESIQKSSKLKNLDAFWDPDIKLIRVGGRLNLAEQCHADQKHPIIMPKCHLARLIIRETHEKNLHAGQNATHNLVRMRYWPIRAKPLIRQELHKCVKCFRVRPRMSPQFMGQLPAERTTPSPPFYHTGVDYCGPFSIKLSRTRNAKAGKAYVALFVCLATKAIHMEIVSELTTEAFFAAFDKFISRRGLPKTMHSDNGLNFVGASNELRELYDFLAKNTTQAEIQNYLTQQEIEWNFIPPRAPEHGGLWEAGVKSMKHHFYRVAENALLTFEEFDRLKSKIEAILNSRPLTAISDDPSDFSALTAGHFLIGRPLVAKPDHDLTQANMNRLQRWDRVIQIQQHFWKRWSRDYLHQLQVRTKNYKEIVPISVGQLVLLHVDNTPPMLWPLGRITSIFPGKDGITRVASVRTAKSTYERPLNKLALLPIDPTDDQLEPAEDVRRFSNNDNNIL